MVNSERMMLNLYNKGVNRKEVENMYNAYPTKDKFDTKIPVLDDMSKDLMSIMKVGFMANCENQKETLNTADKAIFEKEEKDNKHKHYTRFNAKYQTLMDLYGLAEDKQINLSRENKLVLYYNVIYLMANINVTTTTVAGYKDVDPKLTELAVKNARNEFKALNSVRMSLEKEMFKTTGPDYHFESCAKKVYAEGERIANQTGYTM
ncbi:MAG: hypothetical protein IJW82_01995 [Clostridia bacterium]|nr:hypothetical protein [Clostridia bacterium]